MCSNEIQQRMGGNVYEVKNCMCYRNDNVSGDGNRLLE